jgi:hypothetical protein
MPKIKALLLALAVFLVGPTVALAQPLSDVATYTNWSLQNTSNPLYKDGRKGITHEEATRLPIGTLIALHDGSTHALKRGETVWKLNRELALKAPLASRPIRATAATKPQVAEATPSVPPPRANKPVVANAKPVPIVKPVDRSLAEEHARILARHAAEQKTARHAEEATMLLTTARTNLALATGATEAAFAATSQREARKQVRFAKEAAEEAHHDAIEVGSIATTAEKVAHATDSARARKNAASARTDALAATAAAAEAKEAANRATHAPDLWVMNWPPTAVLVVLGYVVLICVMFSFLPGVFNFFFKKGLEAEGVTNVIVTLIAAPAALPFNFIDRDDFYKKHYSYMGAAPETVQQPHVADDDEPWERELHGTAKPEQPNRDDFYTAPQAAVYHGPRVRSPTVQSRRAIGTSRR